MLFIVHIKSSLITERFSPHEYTVLSSVKLQISDFSKEEKISLRNILNSNGPNIEPYGIPRQISDYLQYEEPMLVLCFLKLRYSNRKFRLPVSNPYASKFSPRKIAPQP